MKFAASSRDGARKSRGSKRLITSSREKPGAATAVGFQNRDIVARITGHHPALAAVNLDRRQWRHAAPTCLDDADRARLEMQNHRAGIVDFDLFGEGADLLPTRNRSRP